MKPNLSGFLVLLAVIVAGHFLYLRGSIWYRLSRLENANGLRVVGWPSGRVRLTNAGQVQEYPLPVFLDQNKLQAQAKELALSGLPPQQLTYPEEEAKDDKRAGVVVAFARPLDRLSYSWGGSISSSKVSNKF